MFNQFDVLETIDMIEKEHLDIRTVTMGISLLPCIRESAKKTAAAVYDRVCGKAEKLVSTAEALSAEYGIPIVNKRVSVTPVSLITAAFPAQSALIGRELDRAAHTLGIDFLGGYSALVHKGTADYEEAFLRTIPEVLSTTERLCSSVNVGSSKSGINMDAVRLMGEIVCETAKRTKDEDGKGCAKLVVFCNAVEDNPFMAGAFHGTGEADTVINVGVSGPGVVQHALSFVPDADLTDARTPTSPMRRKSSSARRSRSRAPGSSLQGRRQSAFRRASASSICRLRPRPPAATRWRTSSRNSDSASSAATAPRRRSPCSTTR